MRPHLNDEPLVCRLDCAALRSFNDSPCFLWADRFVRLILRHYGGKRNSIVKSDLDFASWQRASSRSVDADFPFE
jgi:hypothetical protein